MAPCEGENRKNAKAKFDRVRCLSFSACCKFFFLLSEPLPLVVGLKRGLLNSQ